MKKDTRFSIRKLTVGVASIAVASFLTSGSVDAADLSILHSKDEKAAGYNPELSFEPFPPSISYTQPEAPWMQGSLDAELPGDDVEEVTEPSDPNYVNPEAPFAPVEEDEEVTEPRKPNYEDPEAPFAPVEEDEEVTEPRKPNYEDPEAPFAPVEEDEEVTEPRKPNYEDPEAPFAPVEDDEEDLEFEVLPGYKVEEAIGADGKPYKRLVPIEEEETPETEEDEFEVLPGYKVEEAIGADGKPYKRLVPIEVEVEEENLEVPGGEETPEVPGEEEIPYETEERENPELPEGERNVIQEGKTGKKNVHTGEVIEQPVPEIVEVGTKVVTEDIPFEKEERENPELPEGERKVIQEGKLGKKNVHTGEVITEPVNEIIEIGTKVITEEIPYETEERKNPELPEGERKVIQEGKSGKKNVHTGEIIDEPVKEIVEIGTKVITEEIPFETEERENPELPEGESNVIQEGKPGKKNVHTGEVIEAPTPEIVEIGTKVITEDIPYETEQHENPDLPEGERKVIQEGKPGKKNQYTGEVIEQPTPEIVEIGTKVITEDIPFETEERENPDLPEGERKVIQEGKPGKKNVHTGEVITEPVNEIIELGTKEDKLVEWDVPYKVIPLPSPKLKETVVETRHALNTDVKDFYDRLISENSDADSSSTDELTDDQKAQVLASALDYYRKAMGDENIKLEQLITDSADKKGSFYETLVLAGANKLGITEIEKDQEPDYYKNILLENKAYDGKQIYKDIVVQENSDGTLTSGTPSPEAMETVTKNLEEIEELLEFGHGVFINYVLLPEYQNAIRSTDIPEEDKKKLQAQLEEIKNFDKLDTTAASLDFYRVLTNKPEATLQDVLIDWAQSKAGLTLTGALEMVNRYDSSVGGGTDTLNVYKKLMRTRHGQLMESEWTFFTDPFFKILEGIGETVEP